jgi:hypothetical protein
MSELGRFVPEDRDLLVGLPFRVGNWISHIDDEDLEIESEIKEHARMVQMLNKLARAEGMAPLICELAEETLRREASWSRWEAASDDLLDDVRRAVKLLKDQGTPDESASLRRALMTIGTAVARAVRENPEHGEKAEGGFSWLSEKIGRALMAVTESSAYADLNISPAEDTALTELLEALKS